MSLNQSSRTSVISSTGPQARIATDKSHQMTRRAPDKFDKRSMSIVQNQEQTFSPKDQPVESARQAKNNQNRGSRTINGDIKHDMRSASDNSLQQSSRLQSIPSTQFHSSRNVQNKTLSNLTFPSNLDSITNPVSLNSKDLDRQIHHQDLLKEESSSYSFSRTGVSVAANNHDNNHWKPIPNDYNTPLIPVQIDIVDGIYVPADDVRSTIGRNRRGILAKERKYSHGEKNLEQQLTSTQKIFKRVLLCDKTLISLDFAQDLNSEHRPYNGIDSNKIDLDAMNIMNNDENIVKARSSYSESFKYSQSSSHNEMKAINRNSINSIVGESEFLIACDMWDLEKGLLSRKPPREIIRMAVPTDFSTMRDAINRCRLLTEMSLPLAEVDQSIDLSPADVASIFSAKRGLIPGTKWCGIGDSASSYNDLGTKKKVDICCRAHDHCPLRLKPFRQGYGVLNLAIYTKSHCGCDEDFYKCLKSTRTKVADAIGNIYFNVLKLQCLHEEKLKVCTSKQKMPLGFEKCVKWEYSSDKKIFRFIQPPEPF